MLLAHGKSQMLVGRCFHLTRVGIQLDTTWWVAIFSIDLPFWGTRAITGLALVVSTWLGVGEYLVLVLVFLFVLMLVVMCCVLPIVVYCLLPLLLLLLEPVPACRVCHQVGRGR